MKADLDKRTAETRVIAKYKKLYTPLVELVAALQNLDPGGTLVDEAKITQTKNGVTDSIGSSRRKAEVYVVGR